MKKLIYFIILGLVVNSDSRSQKTEPSNQLYNSSSIKRILMNKKEGIPDPPADLFVSIIGEIGELTWKDNSSNEAGFIIRRTLADDSTKFAEIARVPTDTTRFIVIPLPHEKYIFRVSAFNSTGESEPSEAIGRHARAISRIDDFEAIPRYQSILLTWKNYSEDEEGFLIVRDGKTIADVRQLPPNTRYYLDENLDPQFSYTYLAYISKRERISRPSKVVSATPLSTMPLANHTNSIEVDNLGGGAGGWSRFTVAGIDRLYDGHLQLWTGGDVVYDGDDRDFESSTSIVLNPVSSKIDYEYTAAAPGSHNPVILKCDKENIIINQYTFKKKDQNWILIDWEVRNNALKNKAVKLALFLDVDASGGFVIRDYGGFDEDKKIVYINDENENIFVGMAIVSEASYFDNYQICHFLDPRAPDNSNYYKNGENARIQLFKLGYNTGLLYSTRDKVPTDLTMTLISNLGTIPARGSKRVFYAISTEKNLADLQKAIDDAKKFVQLNVTEKFN